MYIIERNDCFGCKTYLSVSSEDFGTKLIWGNKNKAKIYNSRQSAERVLNLLSCKPSSVRIIVG